MIDKRFKRSDSLFSLCGLNCSLCPMFIRGNCNGCRADSPCYQVCVIGPCSIEHGNVDYCFECGEYPCEKYDGIDEHDSLMSHINQKRDMQKAKEMGIEAYRQEQRVKIQILDKLLKEYDNGRRDVFFCLAVNLLEIDDLYEVINKSDELTKDMDLDEKSSFIKGMLNEQSSKIGIVLRLRN